jgi:Xaa-Pro aminopeptidase/Xaa-Pro dipeptidase
MYFNKEIYINRRKSLKNKLKSGLILINGNDLAPMNYEHNVYHFVQDATFLYYFGIEKEGLFGLIDIDNDIDYLVGNDASMDHVIWEGATPSISDYSELIGTDKTMNIADLEELLRSKTSFCNTKKIYFTPQYRGDNKLKMAKLLNLNPYTINEHIYEELLFAIASDRNIKTSEEIKLMDEAAKVGVSMHLEALKSVSSAKKEYEVESDVRAVATKNYGSLSFPSIVTINGQTLHNPYYNNDLKDGRLLLVDAGVRMPSGYCSDMTSTIPINGKFTDKQRDMYNLLLEMYDKSLSLIKPGITYKEVHLEACKVLATGMVKRGLLKGDVEEIVKKGVHALFMPHGLGHMIGLDVHDMESYGEEIVGYNGKEKSKQFGLSSLRLGRKLEMGFAITVEPGIYFIPELISKWKAENKFTEFINYEKVEEYLDFGGMRYENDFIVTKSGPYQLGGARPKTADEIEAFIAKITGLPAGDY